MADIPPLTITQTFGDWLETTNNISEKLNAFGDADAVTIEGGAIDGTTIGATTPADATFENLEATGNVILTGASIVLDDNQISGDKIAGGTIECTTVELSAAPTANNQATTKLYVDTFVNGPDNIAPNAVTTTKINDGAVTASKIASDAVTTAKILNANVTTAKIADDAITTAKILDANVTANKIADGAVSLTGTKIAGVLGQDFGGTGLTAPWNAGAFFYSNSATTFALSSVLRQSSGKIGIGIAGPSNKFHLHEETAATAVYQQISNATTGSTGSDGLFIGIDATGEAIVWNAEAKSIIFGTNNSERGRFDSSGNLGLGITTPQNRVHLHQPSSAAVYQQYTNTTTGSSTGADGLLSGLDSSANGIFWQCEYKSLIFATSNMERMRINENGLILVNGAPTGNPHFDQTTGSILLNTGAGIQAWNTVKAKATVTLGSYAFTYVQSGTTLITVTRTTHNVETGDYVQLDFTSGTATDMGGYATKIDANTFTVIGSTSVTTSGSGNMLCNSKKRDTPFAVAVLRNTTGQATFYFNSGVFPDANYGVISAGGIDGGSQAVLALFLNGGTKTTTQCTLNFTQIGVALRDVTSFTVAFI